MGRATFILIAIAILVFSILIVLKDLIFGLGFAFTINDYFYFAGYVVLQFIVLATAWNILGGYCGYVNFGTAAFFAIGAYTSVALHKFDPAKWNIELLGLDLPLAFLSPLFPLPIPVLIVVGGIVSGIIGLGMGYLTLRLRGAFFAIATLALAVVLQTLVINWDYVGGSRGAYIIRPNSLNVFGFELGYIQYLFLLMLVLAVAALTTARTIERSRLGFGFATIRDDELAAEACGVPTLRLKLIATTLSGAFMGMAGAPFPYYIGYLEPSSAFGLAYAVNAIAMPMIGGTTSWIGPLIGAILLGTLQQVATVTISSAVNLLLVGILLVDFVIIAPNGIVGLIRDRRTESTIIEPAVFVLLYITNVFPMFFLVKQGPGAQAIAVVFWAVLIFVAYARGRMIGRPWLMAFPWIGACLSLAPVGNSAPIMSTILLWSQGAIWISLDAATIMVTLSALVQIIGIICGLATERRAPVTVAR